MSSTEVLLGDAAICNIHLVPLKFLCNHHNIKPFDMLTKFNTFEKKYLYRSSKSFKYVKITL